MYRKHVCKVKSQKKDFKISYLIFLGVKEKLQKGKDISGNRAAYNNESTIDFPMPEYNI